MHRLLRFILFLFGAINVYGQSPNLSYYFPKETLFDPKISKPSEILGHEVGEYHVTHDKLVFYLQLIAHQSDRVSIDTIGYTHEHRPLILLTITSPKNLSEIHSIKENRRKLLQKENTKPDELKKLPLVIWMGYSIHGDEPSGSNAAILLAYYLAAAKDKEIEQLLSNSIILMDPCSNPDGLQRYATWVNTNKSKNLVGDVNNREYLEPWPRGRTNHYWFDLNRDWILLQQPESKARIKVYHEWKPNIVTDHHEMGIQSTLFFQPGVASRKHPLISNVNQSITDRLSKFHIEELDKQQELYFSKEGFDDFYIGKGSTYPDINGGIGILFEQGSSQGHLRETQNGLRNFPSTIKNQLTVSLTTLNGCARFKDEIQSYQLNFYHEALNNAKKDPEKAYIVGDSQDPAKLSEIARILSDHDIQFSPLKKAINISGKEFHPESSYVIPLEQVQYTLIKGLFEKRTTFEDSLFYDISAWSFDLAFNLDFEVLQKSDLTQLSYGGSLKEIINGMLTRNQKDDFGYVFRWDQLYAPALLYQVQSLNIKAKVATKGFTDKNGHKFPVGTIIIPQAIQVLPNEIIYQKLDSLGKKYLTAVNSLESGNNLSGIDIGSDELHTLEFPSIAMVVGEGVNANEAGEIWNLLDQKMNIPLTLIPERIIATSHLSRYTTIIFPDGNFEEMGNTENLKNWLKNGGTIIAQNDALRWLKNAGIFLGNFKPLESQEVMNLSYIHRKNYKGAQSMSGAIFQTNIDNTHPLCYGYKNDSLPVFKNSKIWLDQTFMSFNNPMIFSKEPLLAGYISEKNLESLKNTSAVTIHSYGEGKVIGFGFNPNFRGFWYGTEKLFLNAIFFGSIIETQL